MDEAYVFVCYDSRAGRARFTPHTGEASPKAVLGCLLTCAVSNVNPGSACFLEWRAIPAEMSQGPSAELANDVGVLWRLMPFMAVRAF